MVLPGGLAAGLSRRLLSDAANNN
eukprot:COSAG04_NODE_30652_length_261_cov_0.944444_1_plen_23_part_01